MHNPRLASNLTRNLYAAHLVKNPLWLMSFLQIHQQGGAKAPLTMVWDVNTIVEARKNTIIIVQNALNETFQTILELHFFETEHMMRL